MRLGAGGKRLWRANWGEVGRDLGLSDMFFFLSPFEMWLFGREKGERKVFYLGLVGE